MEPTKLLMEQNLQFLADTDVEYARAVALWEGLDNQTKIVKAVAFNHSRETSAQAREQVALASMSYQQHMSKVADAHLDMLTLREKRNTAETIIRCWQCLNAARSRANIY